MLSPQAATDATAVARTILTATRDWHAPVLAVFAGGARVAPGIDALEAGGVPCYPFPERAVGALAHAVVLAGRRRIRPAEPEAAVPEPVALPAARAAARTARDLGIVDAAPLLEAYGIPVVPARQAHTPAEAANIAQAFGGRVALKILSKDISHKSDVGGVMLDVPASEVGTAAANMLARVAAVTPLARLDGVLVQPMVTGDRVELLLGMVRDAQFGPLVMVGFGGIFVEILGDVATRLAPLDHADARAMLDELRMAPALHGARGQPPVDLNVLADVITRFSRLVAEVSELRELEINPLLAGASGSRALDVRGRAEGSD
jgi:acetyltransferase